MLDTPKMSWLVWLVISFVGVSVVLRPLGHWLKRKGRDYERHRD